MRNFKRFLLNTSGSMAFFSAVTLVGLTAVTGSVIDYTTWSKIRTDLQYAADTAAVTSAKELAVNQPSNFQIQQIAKQYAVANFSDSNAGDGAESALAVDVGVSDDQKSVTVNLIYRWDPFFLHWMTENIESVRASATANLALAENHEICILALDRVGDRSIDLSNDSSLEAEECAVYSNSSSQEAIHLNGNAELTAAASYVVGDFSGAASSYDPIPATNSPVLPDPLASRQPPEFENCPPSATGQIFGENRIYRLDPGTFCGGLEIRNGAQVIMNPGIYVIKNGPLLIKNDSTLTGENVGFFFTGDLQSEVAMSLGRETSISLTAPEEDELAGILFYQDRASDFGYKFQVRSQRAGLFEGTIYLPHGEFIVSWEEEEPESLDGQDGSESNQQENGQKCEDDDYYHEGSNRCFEDVWEIDGGIHRVLVGGSEYYFGFCPDFAGYCYSPRLSSAGRITSPISDWHGRYYDAKDDDDDSSSSKFGTQPLAKVGENSKWTAIVANRIVTREGPDLQINSDYEGSSIPVPDGLLDLNGRSYLAN